MVDLREIVQNALRARVAIPAFNAPYLPMIEPVIRAVVDQNSFALIETARLEWLKFEAGSPQAVAKEFFRWQVPDHVRLHLDHVPVIDEDGQRVNYLEIIQQAIGFGYHSVMVDGSRLPLDENIASTRQVADLARKARLPCEAELGAVLGHEAGPLPPYDELFASGQGFTKVDEARRFVAELDAIGFLWPSGISTVQYQMATKTRRRSLPAWIWAPGKPLAGCLRPFGFTWRLRYFPGICAGFLPKRDRQDQYRH